MRMLHYYLALALILVPGLFLTVASGIWHDGSDRHLLLGLFVSVLAVATNTLLILFQIVTDRVLRSATQARQLSREFLAESNQFFARRRAYPTALIAAASASAAAVLGYGRYIGLSPALHVLAGIAAAGLNLFALGQGASALRANQRLLDRAASELDRLDATGAPATSDSGPTWAYSPSARWLIFALSAWGPYLYWSLVVWRGDLGRVTPLFPALTLAVSTLGLMQAWRSRARSS